MRVHERTENVGTVSTLRCPIQSLRKVKALYGTTGGTYSARVFRPACFNQSEMEKYFE